MADIAVSIAQHARRMALIEAIRSRPELTLVELHRLLSSSQYAEELHHITIRDLVAARPDDQLLEIQPSETIEEAILRVFARVPGQRLASGFFCRYMGLERWTAQKVLAEMAESGLLVRSGKTSGTRYCLAPAVIDDRFGTVRDACGSKRAPRDGRAGRVGRAFAAR